MTLPRIGISSGDPAGIGPELALRLLAEPHMRAKCIPIVFADASVLTRVAATAGLPVTTRTVSLHEWQATHDASDATIVDCGTLDGATVKPGVVSAACGLASYIYIAECTRSVLDAHLDAIATGPIHKEAIHLAGVPHPGHTEIITALTGASDSCMMLTSEKLSVSFVTTHVGYAEVPRLMTRARIQRVIELSAEALTKLRGRRARIVVCGLNPHAGENGLFGNREEEELIAPAVASARRNGIMVEGPVSPDAAFLPTRIGQSDCVVCMYHDQGHIPFKQVAFDTGVNVTLGLPIVRTSVDHGTAFDIAWQGKADARSLYEVIDLSIRLARGRVVEGVV